MVQHGFSLIVLAGGESCRMGTPKHLLPFQGTTLLGHILKRLDGMFSEVLIVGGTPGIFPDGARPVADVMPLRSPLVGILSGLLAISNPRAFVTGCDMPFIEPGLVELVCSQAILGADVTVPVVRGFREPLCAAYRRCCADPIEACLKSGNLKATGFHSEVSVRQVSERAVRKCDPNLNSFININTPGEYRRWCSAAPAKRG